MKYRHRIIALAIVTFFVSLPVYAEGGCVDSPENPTAILAVVGSTGFVLALARNSWKKNK